MLKKRWYTFSPKKNHSLRRVVEGWLFYLNGYQKEGVVRSDRFKNMVTTKTNWGCSAEHWIGCPQWYPKPSDVKKATHRDSQIRRFQTWFKSKNDCLPTATHVILWLENKSIHSSDPWPSKSSLRVRQGHVNAVIFWTLRESVSITGAILAYLAPRAVSWIFWIAQMIMLGNGASSHFPSNLRCFMHCSMEFLARIKWFNGLVDQSVPKQCGKSNPRASRNWLLLTCAVY